VATACNWAFANGKAFEAAPQRGYCSARLPVCDHFAFDKMLLVNSIILVSHTAVAEYCDDSNAAEKQNTER
jgi:hypothetical protein